MNPFALSGLLTGITSFAMGVFVYLKNPKNKINRLWSLFTFSVAIWGFGAFKIGITKQPDSALFWWRVAHIGIIFIPVLFVHFTNTFLSRKEKWLIISAYILGAFFLITNLMGILIKNVEFVFNSFYYDGRPPTPLYIIFALLWFSTILYSHLQLLLSIRKSSGNTRHQIRYFFFATTIGFLGGTTCFLPVFGINLYPYGNFTVPLYPLIMSYAIVKYRLMDIKLAITKTASLIITYGITFLLPVMISTVLRPDLMKIMGDKWWLVPVAVYSIAITFAPFMNKKLQTKAENQFLKDQKHSHDMIATATRNIGLIRNFNKILNWIVRALTVTLGITHASIYLLDRKTDKYRCFITRWGKKKDADTDFNAVAIDVGNSLIKYLHGARRPLVYEEIKREYEDKRDIFTREIRETMLRLSADVIVPYLVEDELIGFLVLGAKKSGEMFSNDDLNVLSNMANHSALAIENAQFLKEREDMQAKLREAETLTTIRDLLGSFNHEIYNLLTPISGTLQGIIMGDYEKKPEKLKPDVQKSVDITFFIKTYLGWVREYVECGDKIAAYQLSELVNGGISYSKDKIEKQNIQTQVNISPKIFIVGHESLPLLFKHLILHSIYGYGMENGGTINISARILEDGAMVEIIQTDTGEDLTKYIKEGSTMGGTKFAEKGKLGGANYFIAQAVVSKHKGIFEVEPTGGKGTKFNIRLPLDFNKAPA